VLFVRVAAVVLATVVVVGTVTSAVRTFVVPRAIPVALSSAVFVLVRRLFLIGRGQRSARELDGRLAFYAPTSLLVLPAVWLTAVLLAFAAAFWAIDGDGVWNALETSGSSLLTLGFQHPGSRITTLLSFVEAAVGLALLALLITYLPTIYGAFTRREAFVSLLEVRAGTPPWAVDLLLRSHRIGLLERNDELFERAQLWFSDIEESHSSIGSLVFFRSPQPERSWVAAAGTVLDAAAITLAAVDRPADPHAALCIRSGYLCLRRIADFYDVDHDVDPGADDPISIRRDEFDDALDRLAADGTPLKADRDQAWRDFAGWRVNYDAVLLQLAHLTMAPEARWTSDRGAVGHRPAELQIRRRRRRQPTPSPQAR
jgi:hypothetical protein